MIIPTICLTIGLAASNDHRQSMFHNTAFQLVQPSQSTKTITHKPVDSTIDASSIDKTHQTTTPPTNKDTVKSTHNHFRRVDGFGQHVSLEFAVRQIVPPHVKVTFAPDVDISRQVNWAGGDTWNRVLASTVAPLGYAIDVGHNSVRILTKKAVSSHHDH